MTHDLGQTTQAPASTPGETLAERIRRVISVHFDPVWGSAFWLARAASLGIDGLRQRPFSLALPEQVVRRVFAALQREINRKHERESQQQHLHRPRGLRPR